MGINHYAKLWQKIIQASCTQDGFNLGAPTAQLSSIPNNPAETHVWILIHDVLG
jgi:hypothetical protein